MGRGGARIALLLAAAMLVAGCGIDAENAVNDVFNVETNPDNGFSVETVPTTPAPGAADEVGPEDLKAAEPPTEGDLEAAAAVESSGGASDIEVTSSGGSAEPPPTDIPLETADAEARKLATSVAKQAGFTVPAASWVSSCNSTNAAWSCSITYSSCAGTIVVSRDPGTSAIRAARRDFGCAS